MSDESAKQGPVHDPFTIQQFREIKQARSLFQEYAPRSLAEKARWESLKLLPGHFIDRSLRAHFADLLFSVEVEGETILLYILFEHKSWVDSWVRLQLLAGMCGAWVDWARERVPTKERPVRLPFILPFVLYHGQRDWTVSKDFRDLVALPEGLVSELKMHVPGFEHVLIDLHSIPMEELRGTLIVKLVLGLLKAVSEGREEQWAEMMLGPSLALMLEPDKATFVRSLFEYIARASETATPSTFARFAGKITDQNIRKDIMTLAERFIQEGWQKGQQEGWQKGQRKAIVELLELRLGPVPSEVREKLDDLKSDTKLSQALLLASRVDSFGDFCTALRANN